MLVAPLMSSILGLSLASVAGEREMFQRAVLALTEGVALALALSAIWGWLAQALPFDLLVQLPDEIQARTRPSPLDLGIALAGGMAAAYALAQPRLSAALPGVATATALMPPVCTVGIGIALSDPAVAFGAALLFFYQLCGYFLRRHFGLCRFGFSSQEWLAGLASPAAQPYYCFHPGFINSNSAGRSLAARGAASSLRAECA